MSLSITDLQYIVYKILQNFEFFDLRTYDCRVNKENIIFSELTKRQRKIIEAFDIDLVQKHSY